MQITARLINVETGEILASVQGKGEPPSAAALNVGRRRRREAAEAAAAGLSMGSSNFGATIIGEATNEAVTQCAMGLDEKAASLPARVVVLDGLVADVDGAHLILNVGTSSGIKVGATLTFRASAARSRTPPPARFYAARIPISAPLPSRKRTRAPRKAPTAANPASRSGTA